MSDAATRDLRVLLQTELANRPLRSRPAPWPPSHICAGTALLPHLHRDCVRLLGVFPAGALRAARPAGRRGPDFAGKAPPST